MKMNKFVLSFLLITILVVVCISTSYAYMTKDLSGNGVMSVINSDNGKLVVAFQGNFSDLTISGKDFETDIIGSKTFSITGTSYNDNILYYNLSIDVIKNDFEDNDIYFVLNGKTDGDGSLLETSGTKTKYFLSKGGNTSLNLGNGFFSSTASSTTHTYIIHYFNNDISDNTSDKEFTTRIRFSSVN